MADSTKYIPINEPRSFISDLKFTNIFSIRTRKTKAFVYLFVSVFVAVTFFLAFNPSPDPSSPWFSNIFATNSVHNSTIGSNYDRSRVSNVYSLFFPSKSQNSTVSGVKDPSIVQNRTGLVTEVNGNRVELTPSLQESVKGIKENNVSSGPIQGIEEKSRVNNGTFLPKKQGNKELKQGNYAQKQGNDEKIHGNDEKKQGNDEKINGNEVKKQGNDEKIYGNNEKKQGNEEKKQGNEVKKQGSEVKKQGIEDLVKNLVNCNLFDGKWVKDESYPLYKPGSCSLIDEQFNCISNGRLDLGFQQYKWKPNDCTLPRLDGIKMLQLLRGKRLVFVGDSLNRNMWESLVCILRNSVQDKSKVYEASGRHHFRSEASYAFVFKDYNCTVEMFVAPFLVQEWETKDKNGAKKETLRLDLISSSAPLYKSADVIVFNTGHWWTHDKTAKGEDYYQEGSHVYHELNVLEAFRKAMTTWGMWVDANINPRKTAVFFRGYSASHFSGGQWNSGGACDHESEPISNTTYLTPYPAKMVVLEKVFKGMKTRVSYLNVTRLTDFRKDGHPSVYRKQHYSEVEMKSPLHYQDCSHWCLPGVPDAWNEILYSQLLVKQYQSKQKM